MNDNTQRRHFRFICACIGVGGVGLIWLDAFLAPQLKLPQHISEVIHALGEALIVAAVLAVVVDEYIKERLVREASRDIAHYLLGYGFPDEGKEKIKEILFNSPIILENFEVVYQCLPWADPGRPDWVKIRYTKRYDVVNLRNRPEEYDHGIGGDVHDQPENFALQGTSSETGGQCNGNYRLTQEEIAAKIAASRAQNTGEIEVKNRIWIRPNSKAKKTIWYKVQNSYTMTVPKNYGIPVAFGSPVIDVTIRAECPGLHFSLYGATKVTENTWEYHNRFFLPGAHIPVRWGSSS